MEINNSFEVPLPPKDAWKVLLDIERIAPCMPGAELTGKVDNDTYNGKVAVKLGPVALAFQGQVKFTEIDEANLKARAKAQGKDSKGRGGANATVDFHLVPIATGTQVVVKTDLNLSGAVAQYGRASGLIQDVASQLIGQFASCLKSKLAASATARPSATSAAAQTAAAPQPAAAKPISGFSLMFRVLLNSLRRLFGGK
jgi:carbon monoxide dehydrogenase subunit G